jgi:nucleoside phosphorylase
MRESSAAVPGDLCIVTAVDVEFNSAASFLSDKSVFTESRVKILRGLFGGRRVTVLQSQMGARGFAEWLSRHLADNRYDALVVVGLAGGVDPKLRVGDSVLYDLCYDARAIDFPPSTQFLDKDVGRIASDASLTSCLFEALRAAQVFCVRGSGVTASRIITESRDKMALGVYFSAAAVDLETYEAISACSMFNLPTATLRVISDEAGTDIPDFNQAYDADGRMNGLRMAVAMLSRPAATLRFLLNIRRVLNSLRENLRVVLNT